MATAAFLGLGTGKRLLSPTFYPAEISEKVLVFHDHGSSQFPVSSMKNTLAAKRSSSFGTNPPSNRCSSAIKAFEESFESSALIALDEMPQKKSVFSENRSKEDSESSLEAFLLLQKSMLEKLWKLSLNHTSGKSIVVGSGISARRRRMNSRRKHLNFGSSPCSWREQLETSLKPGFLERRPRGYLKGTVGERVLTHAEVVDLSKKIKAGLLLEDRKSKLAEKLGFQPSDKQLASFLEIPCAELQARRVESDLAREKLAMSNVRLVTFIAQKYSNSGADLSDLIQGGLIGLLRGIEKFDSSKGFRISTYVYWWIRQGVSRALVENCKTLRLPTHLHERLSSIRNARIRLEEKGVTPSVHLIAESLNMSEKKVRNATEAVNKIVSLDREAFRSLSCLPGETLHSCISDNKLENNPWHGFEEWSLKDEVHKLLHSALGERERDIIRLYHGLDTECHTWEDISGQYGLSRERVRQVGLVAMQKLKRATKNKGLQAMLIKH